MTIGETVYFRERTAG